MALTLKNPHSVLAALETRPHDVVEVRLYSQAPGGAWDRVAELALANRIPVQRRAGRPEPFRKPQRKDKRDPRRFHRPPDLAERPPKFERTGAAEATVKERQPVELDDLFSGAAGRAGGHGIWLALDHLQDPHNVGAVFRTAAFFGVEGIVVTRDRSAPLNATVYDVASGGIEYVPFCVRPNLSQAFHKAKKSGVWVLGTDEDAAGDVAHIAHDRPWLVVLGSEEKGLRRLTRAECDETCRLTPRGPVQSLNVSVAAGILLATLVERAQGQ